MRKFNSLPPAGHYNSNYGNFQTELYAQIRHEAFGEDIGQNSWLTSDEQDRFLEWLNLSPVARLLDVACGAGGPALRIAAITGCSIVGIDVHDQAVAAASSLAAQSGLAERAEFRSIDASATLPFSDSSFDAITCIDAINHFFDRSRVIAEWVRLLYLKATFEPTKSRTFGKRIEIVTKECKKKSHSPMKTGKYLFSVLFSRAGRSACG